MHYSPAQKIRVQLEDYKFDLDLKQRLLLKNLTILEIDLLKIIINNSLIISLDELTTLVKIPLENLTTTLNKLLTLNLFTIDKEKIFVNKEIRKFLEIQLERFENDFQPDLDYFLKLIRHIPIEVLINWFNISKTSDDIIQSLIENYFLTPDLFKKYLISLSFEEHILNHIAQSIFENNSLSIEISFLLENFQIDRESLEKNIIVLEFLKICCLQYVQVENGWKEILVPFHEWKNYLLSCKNRTFQSIERISEIDVIYSSTFGFVKDLDEVIKYLVTSNVEIAITDKKYFFIDPKVITKIEPLHLKNNPYYHHELITKLLDLKLAALTDTYLSQTDNVSSWFSKSTQEKAMTLYFLTIYYYRKKNAETSFTDRDIREIEKSLKSIIGKDWVYLDDFIQSLMVPIGKTDKNILQKKGGLWNYCVPKYGEKEFIFIQEIIEKHLFYSGILTMGYHNNKKCISMTPFGSLSLGD